MENDCQVYSAKKKTNKTAEVLTGIEGKRGKNEQEVAVRPHNTFVAFKAAQKGFLSFLPESSCRCGGYSLIDAPTEQLHI